MYAECPNCEKTNSIPDEYNGREVRCLHCDNEFLPSPKPDPVVIENKNPSKPRPAKHFTSCHEKFFFSRLIFGVAGIFMFLGGLGTMAVAENDADQISGAVIFAASVVIFALVTLIDLLSRIADKVDPRQKNSRFSKIFLQGRLKVDKLRVKT